MVGNDTVYGTKVVDSSGYSIARYVYWYNTKYGTISARLFAKLYLTHRTAGYAPQWSRRESPTTHRT